MIFNGWPKIGVGGFFSQRSRFSLPKFLSNCEENNLYDVIEDEIIFLMVVV